MDAKTAFLCAEIDIRIYMTLPKGFRQIASNPDKNTTLQNPILLLRKGIYGLKQSPRLWNKKLTDYLVSIGFRRCEHDHSVYVRDGIILVIYVNDFLIAESKIDEIEKVKAELNDKFKMVDLGEVKHFLGTQVIRLENDGQLIGYGLTQSHYIRKLVSAYGLDDAKSVTTPMAANHYFLKRTTDTSSTFPVPQWQDKPLPMDNQEPCEKSKYLSLTGLLLYLSMCTRPDISYALSHLAQFSADPSITHWKALKQILRYLKSNH